MFLFFSFSHFLCKFIILSELIITPFLFFFSDFFPEQAQLAKKRLDIKWEVEFPFRWARAVIRLDTGQMSIAGIWAGSTTCSGMVLKRTNIKGIAESVVIKTRQNTKPPLLHAVWLGLIFKKSLGMWAGVVTPWLGAVAWLVNHAESHERQTE